MSTTGTAARQKAVIYLRLSVTGDEDSTSLLKMRKDCIRWCEENGIDWSEEYILIDDGKSGAIRREKADRAMRMVREGIVDVIVTWKYDRWSRLGVQSVGELMETLLKTTPRTRFVGVMDRMDSNDPFFPMFASLTAELARMERENIRMRVRTTQNELALQGRYAGGDQLFGYAPEKLNGGGYRQGFHDIQFPILREVIERTIAGEPTEAITRDLNERLVGVDSSIAKQMTPRSGRFNATTLRRVMTNPLLRGMHVTKTDWQKWPHEYNVMLDESTHLPIRPHAAAVTDDEWYLLQDAVSKRSWKNVGQNRDGHLLLRLAVCGICGEPMTRKMDALKCNRRSKTVNCPSVQINRTHAEAVVSEAFLSRYGDLPVMLEVEVEQDTSRVREIVEALEVIGRRTMETRDRKVEKEWLDRKWALLDELEKLESTVASGPTVVYQETGKTYAEEWADSNDNERRALLMGHLSRVTIAPSDKKRVGGTQGREYAASRMVMVWADEMENAA